ncbi:HSP20 family protein [Motilibacter peucedani]|uniref:HSP20 family protein n=1 Tax=Motilibacter peucedani TaxID=598650 RepID=A0A420XNP9_9ACTN|nr:Hsp20/alpha crystallin family protein [Motilibacter peucedani]RKS73833.1 HSP20 family protein [Motilibacter peucedani]
MATRFDPFRDIDRLTERLFASVGEAQQAMRAMPVDLYRSGDHFVLRCDLPGVDPGSIDVGVDGRMLTIRGQRSEASNDVEWLTQERATGTFARQLTLGPGVDLERIEATYTDGVLTLTLPVAEAAKPRRIEVVHGTSGAVTGSASSDSPALSS